MIFLSLFFTFGISSTFADVSSYQEIVQRIKSCTAQVEKKLNEHKAQHIWYHQAPTQKKSQSFRSPTDQWGQWIELDIDQWGQATVEVISRDGKIKIKWNNSCRETKTQLSGLDFSITHPDTQAEWISDEKLQKMIQGKNGIIYIWSPQMLYSAKIYQKFQNVAKQLNIDFIPIGDPRSGLNLMKKSSEIFEFSLNKQKLNSVELYMRNTTTHYPSVVVFKQGVLINSLIVGAMEPSELKEKIKTRLN